MTDEQALKMQVQSYWNKIPCGTKDITADEGTKEYFEQIEKHRYTMEPFIPVFAEFANWRGKNVLEIGCGVGTDLIQFAKAGTIVCGIDLSPRSVEITQKRLSIEKLHAEVKVGDAENLSFPSNYFDLVYSWGVIHHTPNTKKAVEEIHRVLKPGGEIRIMIYHRRSWFAFFLYLRWGLVLGKPFKSIQKIIAEHLESPGTQAYTKQEAKELFSQFNGLEHYTILTPYDRLEHRTSRWLHLIPRWLINCIGNRLGWFMVIRGYKTANPKDYETN